MLPAAPHCATGSETSTVVNHLIPFDRWRCHIVRQLHMPLSLQRLVLPFPGIGRVEISVAANTVA